MFYLIVFHQMFFFFYKKLDFNPYTHLSDLSTKQTEYEQNRIIELLLQSCPL